LYNIQTVAHYISVLEAMDACQARKPATSTDKLLEDIPQLKRSMKYLYTDLTKVKRMAVFH